MRNPFYRHVIAVLFVCKANVCRSPMAEGLLRAELTRLGLQRKVKVDSAGTHAGQPGRLPDQRAIKVCLRAGVNIRRIRTRQIRESDFHRYDLILALDEKNHDWLLGASPADCAARISRLGAWSGDEAWSDIPDPYFGSPEGFEETLQLIQHAVFGLRDHIVSQIDHQ
jgi:protein-tyrosine phosphatase